MKGKKGKAGAEQKGQVKAAAAERPSAPPAPPGKFRAFITHPGVLAGLCFLLALSVRLYVAHFYAKSPDNFQYLALARDMAAGHYFERGFDLDAGLVNSRRLVPLYPALIAAGIKLGGDPERVGTWLAVIMSALTVLPLFAAGVKLGGKGAGAWASIFYAFMPLDLHVADHILTDSPGGLFTALSVLAVLWLLESPSLGRMVAVGIVSALAYLTRDIAFGYIFLSELAFLAYAFITRVPFKRTLLLAGAGLLVFAILSSPFWYYVKVHTGEFRPTLRGGRDLPSALMGYEKGAQPAGAEEEEEVAPTARASWQVVPVAVKTVRLVWEYLAAARDFLPWPFWLFALAGILLWPDRSRVGWVREGVVWLYVAALLIVYALLTPYMVDVRYNLSAMILATLWAGRGAAVLPQKARAMVGDRLTAYPVSALFILSLLAFTYLPGKAEAYLGPRLLPSTIAALFLLGAAAAFYWQGRIKDLFTPRWSPYLYSGVVLLMALVLASLPGESAGFPGEGIWKGLCAILVCFALAAILYLPAATRDFFERRFPLTPYVMASIFPLAALGLAFFISQGSRSAEGYRIFYSRENFRSKTVSGQREAAQDAKRILDVKPGARVLNGKPFFAYYWEGRHVPIAETVAGVLNQLESGAGEYAVIDSLSVRRYRPGLKMLVTAADPFPGAPLSYRRFFREYNKLISVYQAGGKEITAGLNYPLTLADPAGIAAAMAQADKWFSQGYIENARLLYAAVAVADPNNPRAHLQLMGVYTIYGFFDGVSLDRAEDELAKYAFLVPGDSQVPNLKANLQQLRIQHQAQWGSP